MAKPITEHPKVYVLTNSIGYYPTVEFPIGVFYDFTEAEKVSKEYNLNIQKIPLYFSYEDYVDDIGEPEDGELSLFRTKIF